MFASSVSTLARASSRARQPAKVAGQVVCRSMVTKLSDAQTASCAWKKSCYNGIDYTIRDECTVFEGEGMVLFACRRSFYSAYYLLLISFCSSLVSFCAAIQKLAAYDVGCLVTTDANGK